MKTYRLTLSLEAPLSVSGGRDTSNRYELPGHVPATTLRGALAGVVRDAFDESVLTNLFDEDGLRTSALLPAIGGRDAITQIAPLTLRTCKRHQGFRPARADEDTSPDGTGTDGGADPDARVGQRPGTDSAHGVEDTLFAALRFALDNDAKPLSALRACARCENVLRPLGGFIRAYSSQSPETGPGALRWERQPPADRRTQAHVGIDRRRSGAASGVLYAREVISEKTAVGPSLEQTQMQALISAPADVHEHLKACLTPGATVRLGSARSRGLGRCTVLGYEPVPAGRSVGDRVDHFNHAWAAFCGDTPPSTLISLTLETPALFTGAYLEPNLQPAASDLLYPRSAEEASHAETLSTLTKVFQTTRPYSMHAWNGLAQMPHSVDQGLTAGSVIVFEASALTDELSSALAHLEQYGIGLRRELGFGRCRVCDPVHADIHEHTT